MVLFAQAFNELSADKPCSADDGDFHDLLPISLRVAASPPSPLQSVRTAPRLPACGGPGSDRRCGSVRRAACRRARLRSRCAVKTRREASLSSPYGGARSEEHTSELQSLMRSSYAV